MASESGFEEKRRNIDGVNVHLELPEWVDLSHGLGDGLTLSLLAGLADTSALGLSVSLSEGLTLAWLSNTSALGLGEGNCENVSRYLREEGRVSQVVPGAASGSAIGSGAASRLHGSPTRPHLALASGMAAALTEAAKMMAQRAEVNFMVNGNERI